MMLQTWLITALAFGALMAMMAVGVIFSGKRLSGSCGGTPGPECKCSPKERSTCESEHAARSPAREVEEESLTALRRPPGSGSDGH